jgi:hypothetical protein
MIDIVICVEMVIELLSKTKTYQNICSRLWRIFGKDMYGLI